MAGTGEPPLAVHARPVGRFDAALVPAGATGQPCDRWLLALTTGLSPREEVGLFAHALAHFLFDRNQVRLGRARQLDPRDGRVHYDVLEKLRQGDSPRQPLDQAVLDAFPLLAELLEPREEAHAIQSKFANSLRRNSPQRGSASPT
jgi:hypothetical protein